jgi:predicted acyltransferase
VFRGLTIAGMVLVNNPGSWNHIYWPLAHASWHGWTPTDLIFPFFLFIVGVAIPLALGPRVEQSGDTRDLYWKIIRRGLIIFALGLLLAGFPYFQLGTIRIMGVLQRIALFVGTGLMAKLLGLIKASRVDGTRIALKTWIYDKFFLSWAPPYPASLMFAIGFILLWLGLMWILYNRKIFIKV